ncbi:tetratricopeptide repeat protein [Kineosporia sp. J2-2]|uniref:Tetratricopeptide repeat protein n=1 Tax=Kineosporia corallincola TaxID=2835133 RepID=A0ABS5TTN2_9ACTN|nr:ATP-binding protein [Kineosporia corallincola]MBT0774143.1 tetratricopeptide repeat protein [Kineosporia corallincola]
MRNTGPETMAWFEYQHECVALRIIRNLRDSDITSVVTEWSTDYALLKEPGGDVEFVSVKHREPSQPPWSLAELLKTRIFKDLHTIWVGMERRGQYTFETSGGADPKLRFFLQNPSASDMNSEIQRVAQSLEITLEETSDFLAVFSMTTGLPHRAHISDKAVRELAAVLESWGMDGRAAESRYTALLARIVHASTDRPPTPDERTIWLAGFTKTVRDRLATAEQDRRTISMEQARDLLRSQVQPAGWRSDRPSSPTLYAPQNFIGRENEARVLRESLVSRSTNTGQPALVLITGEPGIGKTSLARHALAPIADLPEVRATVLQAEDFRTGQDIVDSLLAVLVPPDRPIEGPPLERTAELSRLTHAGRTVVLLDGVRQEECLREFVHLGLDVDLVCTSRSRLSGLLDLSPIVLELLPLPAADAAALVATVVGDQLTAADRLKLGEACSGSPLAIAIAAARLARQPKMNVERYFQILADPILTMTALKVGQRSMTAIINDSFQSLPEIQREILVTMGVLPSAPISVTVLSAALQLNIHEILRKSSPSDLEGELFDLCESNLIEQIDDQRFRLHDLIYSFARTQAFAQYDANTRLHMVKQTCLSYARVFATSEDPGRTFEISEMEADRQGALHIIVEASRLELWNDSIDLVGPLTSFLVLRGHWRDMQIMYEQVHAGAQATNNASWMTAALFNLAQASQRLGRTNAALDLYRQAHQAALESDDYQILALTRLALGRLLLQAGQSSAAIDVVRPSLGILRELGTNDEIAQALHLIGEAYVVSGHLRAGKRYLRNAARLSEKHLANTAPHPEAASARWMSGIADSLSEEQILAALAQVRKRGHRNGEAELVLALGKIQERLDPTPTRAILSYYEAIEKFRETNLVGSLVQALYLYGRALRNSPRHPEAIASLSESVDLAIQVGNAPQAVMSMNSLADIYSEIGHEELVEALHSDAVSIAAQTGNFVLVASVEQARGRHLFLRGRMRQAAETFAKASDILTQLGPSDTLSHCRSSHAEALVNSGEAVQAGKILERLLLQDPQYLSDQTRAFTLRVLARVYLERNLLNEAVKAIDDSIKRARESRSPLEHVQSLAMRANILRRQEKYDDAIRDYEAAFNQAQELGQLQIMLRVMANRASMYQYMDDTEKAEQEIRRLLGFCEKLKISGLEASLNNSLGAILMDKGDEVAAASHFACAREIATQQGNQKLAATAGLNEARSTLSWAPERSSKAAASAVALFSGFEDWTSAARALSAQVRADELTDQTQGLKTHLQRATVGIPRPLADALYELLYGEDVEVSLQDSMIRTKIEVLSLVKKSEQQRMIDRLRTSRQTCFACSLIIPPEDSSNLMALTSEKAPGQTFFQLAHLACASSSVLHTKEVYFRKTLFDVECCYFRPGRAALVIDCHGGWSINSEGCISDPILDLFRSHGFIEGESYMSRLAHSSKLSDTALSATLTGANFRLKNGSNIIFSTHLDFYDHWRLALRKGTIDMLVGRGLSGLVSDDPANLVAAIERGEVVAGQVPIRLLKP